MNTAARPPLKNHRSIYSAADALKPPPQPEWCVQNLLPSPSLAVLVGAPGSKKTYLALDLAVATALGQEWLGFKTQQSPVLYIDEDAGLPQLHARLNSVLAGHKAPPKTPVHFTSLAGFDLRHPPDAQAILDSARKLSARLIIVDSLSSFLRGPSVNSLSVVFPVLFQLRRLAEQAKAAVLVLHHTNRTGDFRGSSIIAVCADLMLQVNSAAKDPQLNLQAMKSRFVPPPPFGGQAHFQTTPEGHESFHLTPAPYKEPASDEAKVAEALLFVKQDPARIKRHSTGVALMQTMQYYPSMSTKQILGVLSGSDPGHVRNVISELMIAGLIIRADDGGPGKAATYKLA
jgi:hypothetical protein